jgi:riboflavin kinase/FMN adenylyltransferase
MIAIHQLETFPSTTQPISLALGNFDGLHIGHAAVIQSAVQIAQEKKGETWVFTFDPHPRRVLHPETAPPLLNTRSQQNDLLEKLHVSGVILQPFDQSFMQLEPQAFFHLLREKLPTLTSISVGHDWSFGKNRAGNVDFLNTLCHQHQIEFHVQPPIEWNHERVSSTRIRAAVQSGDLNAARHMLARPFSLQGTVVHGEKIGRQLGYPTANIDPKNECLPPHGVYAAQLKVEGQTYDAAAYIGDRRTIHADKPTVLEVHLLKQKNIDLYMKEVEVIFHETIRGDQKFENTEQLKKQIARDLEAIHHTLITSSENNT